jgi:hypothetical protein
MLYLILALVWLTCGVGILAYQASSGDQRLTLHLGGASFSSGWLMLVLSAYNLLRWWTRRPSPPVRGASPMAARRQRLRRDDEPREPDPNFNFTVDPPRDVPPPRE